MSDAGFARRLEMLEETVESLRRLPDRVGALELRVGGLESQVLQLRTEMHDGFSAIRAQMATKEDLERHATKDDLERFATKHDLAEVVREMAGYFLDFENRLAERVRVLVEDAFSRIVTRREGNPGTP